MSDDRPQTFSDVRQRPPMNNDEAPIHSWLDIQRIKDEIFGPEFAAIEVYPARSQLVDVANVYWIWVLAKGEQMPFNFNGGVNL